MHKDLRGYFRKTRHDRDQHPLRYQPKRGSLLSLADGLVSFPNWVVFRIVQEDFRIILRRKQNNAQRKRTILAAT